MSEFPEWVEQRIGDVSYRDSQELHVAMKWIYRLIPNIEELATVPDRSWPWWKRYLWYASR